jgi:two-component sensor histidine kinase
VSKTDAPALKKLQSELKKSKEMEKRLNASLQEKEILLKEIHHRVKNNLQIISSLISLQSQYVQDQKMLTIFRDSESRIRSIALIHENLYQSQNLKKIEMREYISNLTEELFYSYGQDAEKIKMDAEIDDIEMSIEAAIPCGLIITELISNCLKHAFPLETAGFIQIELKKEIDNLFVLKIQDNGVGFPKNIDLNLIHSLGLKLVKSLSKQLKGQLQMTSPIFNKKGSEFKITFSE